MSNGVVHNFSDDGLDDANVEVKKHVGEQPHLGIVYRVHAQNEEVDRMTGPMGSCLKCEDGVAVTFASHGDIKIPLAKTGVRSGWIDCLDGVIVQGTKNNHIGSVTSVDDEYVYLFLS